MSGGGQAKKGAMGQRVVEEVTESQIGTVIQQLEKVERQYKDASAQLQKLEMEKM